MTEWPTVSAKHVTHLERQFSLTVKRVKAKLVVVGAAAGLSIVQTAYPQRFFSIGPIDSNSIRMPEQATAR